MRAHMENHEEIEAQILEILREFLSAAALPADAVLDAGTPLLDSGALDSLGILQLTTRIEGVFGIQVSDEDFMPENFATAGCLARYVATRLPAP